MTDDTTEVAVETEQYDIVEELTIMGLKVTWRPT